MPFGSRGRKGGDTVRAAVESSPSLTPRRIRLTHAAVRRTDLFRVTMLGVVLAGAGCSPRGPEALRRGDQALVAGRVAEAIPLLEQAVTDLPGNAAAWNQLGLAYHAAGRDAEAQKAYLRALNDDRNFFDAHFNLGALQFEQRRWQESERSLRTYLGMEANRTNAAAWRMLGDALLGSRQMDSAERALNTAAQLDPDEASVQNSLGLVLVAKRRPRDAQARFSQAVRMNPQDPGARLNLAIITQQLGDRRAALEQYRAYLALTPAPPDADRVADLVRQMEAQLLPPPLVTTNRIAVTNAVAARPPRAATNLATAVPAPRTPTPAPTPPATPVTTPAGSVAANPNSGPSANPTPSAPPIAVPTTNAAAKPQPVAPPVATVVSNSPGVPVVRAAPVVNTPEPPLEIVRVEDGPTLKIARDASPEVPPAARPSPVATVTAPTNPPAPTPTPVTPTTATLSAATMSVGAPPTATATEPEPAEKKTFWKRVSPANWGNPVKWFRGDEASARTNTPPPAPSQVRTETVVRKAPAPASPTLTPPPVVQVPEAVVVAPTPTPAPTPAPTPPPQTRGSPLREA